jgi:hypothetical protein
MPDCKITPLLVTCEHHILKEILIKILFLLQSRIRHLRINTSTEILFSVSLLFHHEGLQCHAFTHPIYMVLLTLCICSSPFNCTSDINLFHFSAYVTIYFPLWVFCFFSISPILSPYFTTGLTNTLCNLNMYSWTSPLGCETLSR